MIIDHVDKQPVPHYLIYNIVKYEVSIFDVHCNIWNEDSTGAPSLIRHPLIRQIR